MTAQISPDSLHRLVKHAIDSGAATSVAEAEALFRGYRLTVEIDGAAANEPVQQAALLTTVALGRRVFLGGVTIAGALEEPLKLDMPLARTLSEAVRSAEHTSELQSRMRNSSAFICWIKQNTRK